jgi:hypothetical protein
MIAGMKPRRKSTISHADRFYLSNLLDRCRRRTDTGIMRAELPLVPRMLHIVSFTTALLQLLCLSNTSRAQSATVAMPRTTLIVFADRRIDDNAWAALFDALRKGRFDAASASQAMAGPVEIVRGDTMVRGLTVDKSITVYLHGQCSLQPAMWQPMPAGTSTLGWVLRVHGQIEPFIHVDCGSIAQMMARLALGLSTDRRRVVMSEAMARVILHEWMHIATQSSRHTAAGLSKAEFAVPDLLAEDETLRRNPSKFMFAWKNQR